MLSVIIPTYNERENLPTLLPRIFTVFEEHSIEGEVIVVDDDSPDGTGRVAQELARKYEVQVIIRKGERGLATAVLAGFAAAKHSILGVMDADFSHPPEKIPELLKPIIQGKADVVIGSRYIKGGGILNWSRMRRWNSKVATLLAKPLVKVNDPMSGFLCLKRSVIEGREFKPRGYKIALEILVKGKYERVVEIPFTFVDRIAGRSKLSIKEQCNYLRHILRLYLSQ